MEYANFFILFDNFLIGQKFTASANWWKIFARVLKKVNVTKLINCSKNNKTSEINNVNVKFFLPKLTGGVTISLEQSSSSAGTISFIPTYLSFEKLSPL